MSIVSRTQCLAFVWWIGAAIAGTAHAATCFVKADAPSGNDGAAWATATTLQTALTSVDCTEIWVAGGIYKPTTTADRTISFAVRPDTAVYGGFAGIETERSQRNPAANVTILSGDIDGNDTVADGITSEAHGANASHVVTMDGTVAGHPVTASTVLDGLVITGGEADDLLSTGHEGRDTEGGGLFCDASLVATAQCSPTLNNLLFSGNRAKSYGGALFNSALNGGSASPTVTNSAFSNNGAGGPNLNNADGGAVYNQGQGGISSPVFVNVTFSANGAHNLAELGRGGAMFNNGGASGISSPTLTNVTFSDNVADYGGAIFDSGSATHPVLVNVILWGNRLINFVGVSVEQLFGASISHSIVDIVSCANVGATCGDGVVTDADARLGPLQDNGGLTPTFALASNSPAIDAGSDADCPATDQRGVARPQGEHCDIGAYEFVDPVFADGFDGP